MSFREECRFRVEPGVAALEVPLVGTLTHPLEEQSRKGILVGFVERSRSWAFEWQHFGTSACPCTPVKSSPSSSFLPTTLARTSTLPLRTIAKLSPRTGSSTQGRARTSTVAPFIEFTAEHIGLQFEQPKLAGSEEVVMMGCVNMSNQRVDD